MLISKTLVKKHQKPKSETELRWCSKEERRRERILKGTHYTYMHTYKCAVRSKKFLGRTKTDVDLAMTWDMPILSTFFFEILWGFDY